MAEAAAVGESVEVGAAAAETVSEAIDSDVVETQEWYDQPKHLWVLSYAGKPIYSRHGDESLLSSKMGMLSSIVAVVADTKDSLQFFVAGSQKFVFLVRGPIYMVQASRTLEPVWLLRAQLDYVYAHLIFSATSRVIDMLNRSSGTDIRNFLGDGHEAVLERLLVSLDSQLTHMLMSFICLPMPGEVREAVTKVVQRVHPDNALYAVVFSENLLVTYVETKRIPLDVDDLLLLLNWANVKLSHPAGGSAGGNDDAGTSAVPPEDGIQETICLPNLDTSGNVYAYAARLLPRLSVIFVSTADQLGHLAEKRRELIATLEEAQLTEELAMAVKYTPVMAAVDSAASASGAKAQSQSVGSVDTSMPRPATTAAAAAAAAVLPQRDADTRAGGSMWMEPASSLFSPREAFKPWGYDGELWHLVFKSTSMRQIIAAGCEERFPSRAEKVQLFQWQQHVYSKLLDLRMAAEVAGQGGAGTGAAGAGAAGGRAGNAGKTRTGSQQQRGAGAGMLEYWQVNSKAALLGWTTKNWELVLVFSPLVSYDRALEIAQFLIKTWVPREKGRLFMLCENGW